MKWLTKSDYLKFLVHPAWLWLAKHEPDRLPPFGESAQYIVDQGNMVETVARALFPHAHLIEAELFDGPAASAKLLAQDGPKALFQASILTADMRYARADVLVRSDTANNTWNLYEIKSATKVKPEYLHDLAFQRLAFTDAGHHIDRCFVIHINSHYERAGEFDPAKLFITEDVTAEVEALEQDTLEGVATARAVIGQPTCPSDAPELAADWRAWRDIYRHLHPDIPSDSILNLTRLNTAQLSTFTSAGYRTLASVPTTFRDLKPQQYVQIALAKTGRPQVHAAKITHELEQLKFPLYFLDYETFGPALPMFDRLRPYQQIPFQYSLHVLDESGRLTQREFLARGAVYPAPELLKHLQADLGPTGSVIVWNESFEMGRNDALAALHPEFAAFLKSVNSRVYDLMEIFARGYYTHPSFGGSASIKNVLPVLVPELSYKNLAIGEGVTAQLRWTRAARGELEPAEANQIYSDLTTYCGQDTLAMVKIHEFLRTLTVVK